MRPTHLLLPGLLAGLAFSLAPAPAAAEAGNPLSAERWRMRPLVVVAPSADEPVLRRLEGELQAPGAQAAFDEREMVLYKVVGGQGSRDGQPLAAAQTRALLSALDLASPPATTTVLLVGKDGGVKMREQGGLALERIFSTIDAMPMRQP